MNGIRFEEQTSVTASDPNRMDIACFVGFVSRRPGVAVPRELRAWTEHHLGSELPAGAGIDALLDVPLPIESWEVFQRLFQWETRPATTESPVFSTYLGAAVRSFFAQGGRKCYVVRVGDALVPGRDIAARRELLGRLIPGFPRESTVSPVERRTWSGAAHVLGLPDVSLLCLPDLPELVAEPPAPVELPSFPPPLEQFVECSDVEAAPGDEAQVRFEAPRSSDAGYRLWASMLHHTAGMLARWRREVQLIAAVPLALPDSEASNGLLPYLLDHGAGPLAGGLDVANGISTAFLQLVYPWVETPGSHGLPGGIEAPDGVLAGMLARAALTRGAYSSIAGIAPLEVTSVHPMLRRDEMHDASVDTRAGRGHSLVQRVSTFGPSPGGVTLLSDVTTSHQEAYRFAATNRLVASILRGARQIGESAVFEASGEALWAHIERGMTGLMLRLFQVGVLTGATQEEAFRVRCDRTTMTQNDLDNGRAVCTVEFSAALAIERITVALAVDDGGQVTLLGGREAA